MTTLTRTAAGMLVATVLIAAMFPTAAEAQSRLKDLVEIEGVRTNQLVGYGMVVGLDGTGDRLKDSPFTEKSLKGMLERLGVNVRDDELKTRNAASVIVTATLPPFARQGSSVDVTVASLGNASSLLGGTLIVTPLLGADGQAYAVAQGSVAAGGHSSEGDGASVTKGVPTAGRIPGGATVEREVDFAFGEQRKVRLALRNPDFTTALRIEEAVAARLGAGSARMLDPSTVEVMIPEADMRNPARMIAQLENVPVEPDTVAKVVVDERTGTIVIGDNVRISRVAVSQGGLTVRVSEEPQVAQPNALADGDTVVVPRTTIEAEEGEGSFAVLDTTTTLHDLVEGLNALGVRPRDVVAVLQAIKAAGALHADLEVM